MMKNCRKCQIEFEPTTNQIKKRDFLCPECKRDYARQWRDKRKKQGLTISGSKMPREYHRKYEKEYFQNPDVKKRRAKHAKIRRIDPSQSHKIYARDLTNKAIKSGKLIKKPCEVCGKNKVDAHHEDYNKPYDVMWLCRRHHIEHHAKAEGKDV